MDRTDGGPTPDDLEARRSRARDVRVDPHVSPPLSVGYRVTGTNGTVDACRLVADGHSLSVDDRVDEAEVTLSCDADTAAALASNALGVQQAVLAGRLLLSGDLARLAEHPQVAAAIAAVMRDA